MMKQAMLMGFAILCASTAVHAASDTYDYRVNGRTQQDPYALPEYDLSRTPKFVRKSATPQSTAQQAKKNTPALTILNEPYFPSQPNMMHMGQDKAVPLSPLSSVTPPYMKSPPPQSLTISDDVPTDLSPPPVRADIVTMTPPASEPVAIVDTWRAREGESLYQVLNRWSERAGTPMTWSSMKSPKLNKNISFVGTYQDAVTFAMKAAGADGMNSEWNKSPTETATASSMAGTTMVSTTTTVTETKTVPTSPSQPQPLTNDDLMGEPLTPEPLPVQEVASLEAAPPMALEPIEPQQSLPQRARYYALAGTSLKESLRAWSGSQEFSLVWDAKRDFQVKQTVSSNNDPEAAIRDILSMYDNDAVRPVGKLYRDPRTSKPVLVISSDNSRS